MTAFPNITAEATAQEIMKALQDHGRRSLLACLVSVIDAQDSAIEALRCDVEHLNVQLTAALNTIPEDYDMMEETEPKYGTEVFGRIVKRIRKRRKMKRVTLASYVCLTLSDIRAVEAGEIDLTRSEMEAFCRALKITVTVDGQTYTYDKNAVTEGFDTHPDRQTRWSLKAAPLLRCSIDAQDFGRRVRKIRKSIPMTRLDLAVNCGYAKSFIVDVEKGEMFVSPDTARLIAQVLCVDIADIWPL